MASELLFFYPQQGGLAVGELDRLRSERNPVATADFQAFMPVQQHLPPDLEGIVAAVDPQAGLQVLLLLGPQRRDQRLDFWVYDNLHPLPFSGDAGAR
jgi:hypothetical protein